MADITVATLLDHTGGGERSLKPDKLEIIRLANKSFQPARLRRAPVR